MINKTKKNLIIGIALIVVLTGTYFIFIQISGPEVAINAGAGDGNPGTVSAGYGGEAENLQGLE